MYTFHLTAVDCMEFNSDTPSVSLVSFFSYLTTLPAKSWPDHQAHQISAYPCSLNPIQEAVFGV